MNSALAIADTTVANVTKPSFFIVSPRAFNSVMQMVSFLRESANLVDIFASSGFAGRHRCVALCKQKHHT